MTIHAYQETHVNKAQSLLGTAFDYAINCCNYSGDYFTKIFVVSSISKRMEKGDPAIIPGKSGIELVNDIVLETMHQELLVKPEINISRTREYWIGWAVSYYQWFSDRSFSDIFKAIPYSDLEQMYYTLHEADISKFVEIADSRLKEYFPETNLKRIRTVYGLSQSELARKSNVNLRSIQMYEQRNKDINKASVETVYCLSKVLGCSIEELLEK